MLRTIVDHYCSLDDDTAAATYPLIDELGPADAAEEFVVQLTAFWKSERPFHTPVVDNDILKWWTNLQFDSNARVLAVGPVTLTVDIART